MEAHGIWIRLCCILLLAINIANADADLKNYMGEWKVHKLKKVGGGLFGKRQIGEKVILEDKAIKVFGNKYGKITYKTRTIPYTPPEGNLMRPECSSFYGIMPDREKISIIDAYQDGEKLFLLEIISKDEILYKYDGYYYFLKR